MKHFPYFHSKYFILFLIGIILSALTYWIDPLLSIFCIAWYSVFFYISNKSYNLQKSKNLDFLLLSVGAYPPIEIFLKFLIVENIIPYSWFWLNRLEHLFFSLFLFLFLSEIFRSTILKLNLFEKLLFLFTSTLFVGNMIEFIEFFYRELLLPKMLGVYYTDTMLDLLSNLCGTLVAIFVYQVEIFLPLIRKKHEV